jgi:hypothetical protein
MMREPARRMMLYGAAVITAIAAVVVLATPERNARRSFAIFGLATGVAALMSGLFCQHFDRTFKSRTPRQCIGCSYFCGESGVNCSLHPYGPEDSVCIDKELI